MLSFSFYVATVLFWLAISYVGLSFIEFILHGTLMHQPTWLTRNSAYFKEILDEHRSFHHGECFPGQKFDEAEGDCLELNIKLRPFYGQAVAVVFWGPMFALACVFDLTTSVGQFFAIGGVTFMLSLLAHHLTWNLIHIQMHTPEKERASWFKNSSLCLWLARYHYMHHAHPRVNFCIVCPGADWLMGTFKAPAPRDIEDMHKHGFFLPALN